MNSLVVCESWFGNTKQVAELVTDELARHGEATLVSVDDELPPLDEIDLVVVGAPTHIHGMSSSMSRRAALDQSKDDTTSAGRGVRGWLETLPNVANVKAAAFDTRADKPVALVGSAARGIAKRLRRHGFELIESPTSFFITDAAGPLRDGELERAATWARGLAVAVGEETERRVDVSAA